MITLVDSHCHLDFKDYGPDLEPVMARAAASGIKAFLNICTTLEDADPVLATAEKYPNVFASVGIHPHEAGPTLETLPLSKLKTWLLDRTAHPKVIALGETGLDFHYSHSPHDIQETVFKTHIEVAQETGLPLSIHTRAASEKTIELLRPAQGTITGVIHCFSETQWLADQSLSLGFYLSLSGIITFKKADALRDVVKTIPLERLLVETDAPFLAPMPHRGHRNEPAYMLETVKTIAELKGVSIETVAEATTHNFKVLFPKATGF